MKQMHEAKYTELEQQLHEKTYQQTPRLRGVDHFDSSFTSLISTTSTSSSSVSSARKLLKRNGPINCSYIRTNIEPEKGKDSHTP